MPLHDYRCTCGWEGEALVPLAKLDDPKICPECGKETERLIGQVSLSRDGFGYAPGVQYADGTVVRADKKRPSTAVRLKG